MKREFITGLLPDVSKEVLDQIMAEHGKGIESHKDTIATLTAERDGLKTQLGSSKYGYTVRDAVAGIHFSSESASSIHVPLTGWLNASV